MVDTSDARVYRLDSIDCVRGIAIVIMAIDHVRDMMMVSSAQDPMLDPNISPQLFFTRWITHFCAPVFVLLAGTSAGLMADRKSPAELCRFLLLRGLWLIFAEFFIISLAWSFAPFGMAALGGLIFVAMQVIWAIGASMVVLAFAQFLGATACFVIGALIIVLHNTLDAAWPASQMFGSPQPLWVALHAQMTVDVPPFSISFVYPLLPWIGVMLAGFGIAGIFRLPAERRRALLWRIAGVLLLSFIVLRTLDVYGEPNPWQIQTGGVVATVIDFLNTSKYPPSLLFLLMVFAPAAALLATAERWRGGFNDMLVMFGRVPFFFYFTHLVLIHALSALLGVVQGFEAREFMTLFFFFPKNGYGLDLPGIYAAWLIVMVLLYFPCRWMAGVKARRRDWWLSYV
jgi:uncharacterized membrane protein